MFSYTQPSGRPQLTLAPVKINISLSQASQAPNTALSLTQKPMSTIRDTALSKHPESAIASFAAPITVEQTGALKKSMGDSGDEGTNVACNSAQQQTFG